MIATKHRIKTALIVFILLILALPVLAEKYSYFDNNGEIVELDIREAGAFSDPFAVFASTPVATPGQYPFVIAIDTQLECGKGDTKEVEIDFVKDASVVYTTRVPISVAGCRRYFNYFTLRAPSSAGDYIVRYFIRNANGQILSAESGNFNVGSSGCPAPTTPDWRSTGRYAPPLSKGIIQSRDVTTYDSSCVISIENQFRTVCDNGYLIEGTDQRQAPGQRSCVSANPSSPTPRQNLLPCTYTSCGDCESLRKDYYSNSKTYDCEAFDLTSCMRQYCAASQQPEPLPPLTNVDTCTPSTIPTEFKCCIRVGLFKTEAEAASTPYSANTESHYWVLNSCKFTAPLSQAYGNELCTDKIGYPPGIVCATKSSGSGVKAPTGSETSGTTASGSKSGLYASELETAAPLDVVNNICSTSAECSVGSRCTTNSEVRDAIFRSRTSASIPGAVDAVKSFFSGNRQATSLCIVTEIKDGLSSDPLKGITDALVKAGVPAEYAILVLIGGVFLVILLLRGK